LRGFLHQTNMTTADTVNKRWFLTYDVTADFMPYRHWTVQAEGEASARMQVSRETGIPVEELCASLMGGNKMTDEQINAAIAEACGWTDTPIIDGMYGQTPVPNFATDLNAMHEAEKTIYKHNNLWSAYYYAVGAGPFSLHVTARKKAEAFLRALGKWEEVQG
jgi:hypothetical protein